MDIQKTYLKQAHQYLNISIIILIPAGVSLLFYVQSYQKHLLILTAPFLLISLMLFQNHLVNYKKSVILSRRIRKATKNVHFFSCNQLILHVDHQSNKLLFFEQSGRLLGEISKFNHPVPRKNTSNQEFMLIDNNGKSLATYTHTKEKIEVFHPIEGYIGSYIRPYFRSINGKKESVIQTKKFYLDDKIVNGDGVVVFRLRKGWMQLEVQENFLNPNCPNLQIASSLEENQILLYTAALVQRFFKRFS